MKIAFGGEVQIAPVWLSNLMNQLISMMKKSMLEHNIHIHSAKLKQIYLLNTLHYIGFELKTFYETLFDKGLVWCALWKNSPKIQISSFSKQNSYCQNYVMFIPYFRFLVLGILVTLVAWFSFRFFHLVHLALKTKIK